jgi:hypothetical protein
MPIESPTETLLREFRRLKELAERAMAQIDDEAFFATLGEGDNSIAIVVKHLAGNMRSRWTDFLTADGEKLDRNRDSEFVLEPGDSRGTLLERWERGWEVLLEAIRPLTVADFDRIVTIRGEPFTVSQAIHRQLSHYAYHVGQIVMLAKHRAGERWATLSIPRGRSAEFNERPSKHLETGHGPS